jgi:hypothetical protein
VEPTARRHSRCAAAADTDSPFSTGIPTSDTPTTRLEWDPLPVKIRRRHTGRGQLNLTDLEGYRPYIRDEDVVVVGIRDDDEYLEELHALEIATRPPPRT